MHTIYHQISFAEIEQQIDELRALDLANTTMDAVRSRARRLLRGFTCCDELYRHYPILNLWRARRNRRRRLVTSAFELACPPPDKISKYGRFNDIGCPVFYAAADFHTALLEIRPGVGDFITVGRFVPTGSAEFRYMEVGVAGKLIQGVNYVSPLDHHSTLKNEMVTVFVQDELTKVVPEGKESEYKISVAIGEILMQSRGGTLLYPSMIRYRKGINAAVRPDIFESSLLLTECRVFKITERYCRMLYDGVNLDGCTAIDADGTIHWSDRIHKVVENGENFLLESDQRPTPSGIL